MSAKPGSGRAAHDIYDRDIDTIPTKRRSVAKDQAHRGDDAASTEPALRRSGREHPLVQIEVYDTTEPSTVLLGESNRRPLHDAIADTIGVANTLSFDDLDWLVSY